MNIFKILNSIRLVPRDQDFLNRKLGSRGEIFYDQDSNTLRLYSGQQEGGISLAKNDLTNVPNATFLAKASAAGVGSGGAASIEAGTGIEIDTISEPGKTIINATFTSLVTDTNPELGGTLSALSNGQQYRIVNLPLPMINSEPATKQYVDTAISNINVGNVAINENFVFSIAADDSTQRVISNNELIKFSGAGSVTTSSDAEGNITITGATASTSFNSLTDVAGALLTIDEIYLPAITMLTVTNSGALAYLFDQYAGNNPTIYAISGTTIAFKLSAAGHPFLIQDGTGTNYDTGLVHVTTTGVVTSGSAAQGKDSGTLYWKVPASISGGYRYQCGLHGVMVGSISVKGIASI